MNIYGADGRIFPVAFSLFITRITSSTDTFAIIATHAWPHRYSVGCRIYCISFTLLPPNLALLPVRLPAGFKEVVLLHYYQGYGVSEIASMLDISEGTVSSRLSRARSRLQSDLKGDDML